MAARTAGRVGECIKMPMCKPGVNVTNTKTIQAHLSVLGPLCGETPSVDGGLNQGQLIASSPASVPVGLPRLTDME